MTILAFTTLLHSFFFVFVFFDWLVVSSSCLACFFSCFLFSCFALACFYLSILVGCFFIFFFVFENVFCAYVCGCVSYHPRFFFLCVGVLLVGINWNRFFFLLFVMKSILLPLFVVSLVVCFLILILFSKGGVACLWCLYVCVCCVCVFWILYLFYSCYNEFFFLFPLFIGINSNSLLFL